ncbi:MAG: hypothetical protein R3300_06565, partial [Candidatus Promineifilaceae bacterium]|nr:hypothetical protein [Candidatus Promineifilaceae bacterium]
EAWPQLIIYRQDWFQQQGLAPPADFASLMDAAADLFQPDTVVSGIVVPTESDLAATQQVFEQLASANGCDLVNSQGEVALLHPACLEALDFYRELINQYSPIGVQTEVSALNAFLAGRTGIIMASSAVLPQIAGLDPEFRPRCPDCTDDRFLVGNTAFESQIIGSGQFAERASFIEIKNLGITTAADTEAAAAFAQHWFETDYATWLRANPERKIPLRQGTAREPTLFSTAWISTPLTANGPTLADLYGFAEISSLQEDLLPTQRWGFAAGRGELVSALYEELTLSPLLQEMLSGYFTSSQTVVEMQRAVAGLIPGYDFPLPTPPSNDADQ